MQIVGAASMLGGATRMLISITVLAMEGSGSLQMIVPLMVAVTMAKIVGDSLTLPIYDMQIKIRGAPVLVRRPSSERLLEAQQLQIEQGSHERPFSSGFLEMHDSKHRLSLGPRSSNLQKERHLASFHEPVLWHPEAPRRAVLRRPSTGQKRTSA